MSIKIEFVAAPTDGQAPVFAGQNPELTHVMELDMRWMLHPSVACVGTDPLEVTIQRDASQGTDADLLAYRVLFGETGRAGAHVFACRLTRLDDTTMQPVQRFILHRAQLLGIRSWDDEGSPRQEISLRAGVFSHQNGLTGDELVDDAELNPVTVPEFAVGARDANLPATAQL